MKKKLQVFLFTLLVVCISILGLVWLSIGICIITLLSILIFKLLIKSRNTLLKKIFTAAYCLLFIFLAGIGLKIFMFDIFKIPSSSMENTLFKEDVILVSKLQYGPRLPQSPFDVPWLNIAFYFNDDARKRIKEDWWEYNRLPGLTTIKKGDVFVFNSTWDKEFIMVKRCIALPGDTLSINDAEIYINRKVFEEPNSVKNSYSFKVKNKMDLYIALDSFSSNIFLKNRSKLSEANLTRFQLEHLKKQNYIDSVSKRIDSFASHEIFLKETGSVKWTVDNMGPIVIPKEGMQIDLNPLTFSMYGKSINKFEDHEVTEKNGIYFIDNSPMSTYTFKQDYFFMMGDNRKETLDSRKFGFVPESNIVGKVQCVLFSKRE
ncbi:hypothetical protein PW52_07905 [Tamlana sedimentorum]|uniref:Signal peptidase I n=1 Tax=Neotamlana sedimentorum TaxID=1435349 RepID=A0A0D7W948_9FLAO|nr:signal peptidase I [Tamlana sedimentorum]KJD35660.1 hypothetical protein PW52_07905 [Tamlana sedimentorum]